MKRGRRWLATALCGAAALGVLMIGAGAAGAKKPDFRPVDKLVLFASDGMRPDLMEKYAKAGSMPTYKELMKHGAAGDNGMMPAFPPNTGVGWMPTYKELMKHGAAGDN